MDDSVFRYILNRLSVLTDEQLEELDFGAGLAAVNESDLNQYDKNKLNALFLSIQKKLPIAHHGVLGMKWGVRRYQNKDGTLTPAGKQRLADETAKQSIFGTASRFQVETRNGDVITCEPVKPPSIGVKIIKHLFGHGWKQELGYRGDANYTLNNSKGEKIGELSLISKNANTTYWDWITIDDSQRGKGYATDIVNNLFTKAKEAGYSKVEINALEKPRPLYERLGFTYTDTSKMSIIDRITSYEFKAKHMEYDLTELRHSIAEFYHHGVLGMKWGVRRTPEQLNGSQGKKDARRVAKLTKSIRIKASYEKRSLDSLSTLEKQIEERMSNEDYRRVFKKELKNLDNLTEQKHWTKERNRSVANVVAKTVSATTLQALTGQYSRDSIAETLVNSVHHMQTNALIKSIFK